jgi:hypothetical protein
MADPTVGPEHGSARDRDPITSKAAAARVRPGSARHRLLVAHRDNPTGLTDEEAADIAGLSLASEYATRCSELRNYGLIEDTARTRPGDAGTHRMVRRITARGHTVLRGEDPGPAPVPRGPITPFRSPTATAPALSPTPTLFKPRVEVDDVPSPEWWYCWHCGAKTQNKKQPALGGFAEVICPEANRRVIGVPRRDLAKGDGTHLARSKRSPVK